MAPEPAEITEPGEEIVSLRNETSRTYLTPEGDYQSVISTGPVNFKDSSGAWRKIDNTLVASSKPGYAFENAANSFTVYFPTDLRRGVVRLEEGSRWIEMRLDGAAGAPKAEGDSVTYAGAMPGANVVFQAMNEGVKESIELTGPTSTRLFTYQIETSPGLSIRARDGGLNS